MKDSVPVSYIREWIRKHGGNAGHNVQWMLDDYMSSCNSSPSPYTTASLFSMVEEASRRCKTLDCEGCPLESEAYCQEWLMAELDKPEPCRLRGDP